MNLLSQQCATMSAFYAARPTAKSRESAALLEPSSLKQVPTRFCQLHLLAISRCCVRRRWWGLLLIRVSMSSICRVRWWRWWRRGSRQHVPILHSCQIQAGEPEHRRSATSIFTKPGAGLRTGWDRGSTAPVASSHSEATAGRLASKGGKGTWVPGGPC